MHIPLFEGQDYDSDIKVTRTKEAFRVSEPFSIYTVRGRAVLFTNPTMMTVLDRLFESDYTLNELEDVTGVPKGTIYTAVTKLIGMGAVETRKESGSMMKYRLIADPIMYLTESDDRDLKRLEEIVGNFQNGAVDYYASVISFAMEAIECMGIHFDKMFLRAGRNAAMSVLESNGEIQPQEFVELACSMVTAPDIARIKTYIPICLEVILSKSTLWGSWPGAFVMGFVSEGLKRLLGDGYRASVVVRREGSSVPDEILES
jgi:DNA-binding transcriptional ArsR family regulator